MWNLKAMPLAQGRSYCQWAAHQSSDPDASSGTSNGGAIADVLLASRLTQLGIRVSIATIKSMMIYSLSLVSPRQLQSLACQEHGRTILLCDIGRPLSCGTATPRLC
jgi:hypothetical protein